MLVTIFADASFCSRTKAGGWGGWAKSARGSVCHGGAMKKPVANSTTAESYAIVNAIALALSCGIAVKGDKLLIQTDCLSAIDRLQSRRKEPNRAVKIFRTLVSGHDVEFRHVKGHNGFADARSAVNTMCDALAYRGLTAAREAIGQAKGKE